MLSVIVQSHPRRKARAVKLAKRLSATVVSDPRPLDQANPWRTYQGCIAAANPLHWTLILQDDALPHRDLLPICERIVMAHPREVVCLYHGRHPQNNAMRMHMARDRGLAYAQCRATTYVPSVALLYPPHVIAGLQRWVPSHVVAADDEMLGSYLTHRAHHHDTYLVTVPCLVDHDDGEESLMGTTRLRPAEFPPPEDLAGADWSGSFLAYL